MSSKVVIVTGASRGLGRAAALFAGRLGARLVVNARSVRPLEALAEEIAEAGSEATVMPGDIADPGVCALLAQTAIERYGRIDALINNASMIEPLAGIATSDPAEWLESVRVNVLAIVMLVQAALPALRESQGRVISVSSGAAVRPTAGWGAYCVSKAAVNQFNAVLALEEPAVTAVAFRPGVVDTEMQRAIRQRGAGAMTASEHQQYIELYEEGELLPPERPGRALAVMSLHTPPEWSGEFIRWNEPRVTELVERFAGAL